MDFGMVANSQVQLTGTLKVRGIRDEKLTLSTVGEAVRFLLANFSEDYRVEQTCQLAANALEIAAATNDTTRREYATKAVIALLHSERILERP